MAKKNMKPKGKTVKGCDYAASDEKYDRKQDQKQLKNMKTPGMATELKMSQKEEGYSKQPRVKPQKKNMKPVMGQKKVY